VVETESGILLVLELRDDCILDSCTISLLVEAEVEGVESKVTPHCPKCGFPMDFETVIIEVKIRLYSCPIDGELAWRPL
jgi:hypothetical protein